MIVSLPNHVLVSPGFFRVEHQKRLSISIFDGEVVVGELEGIVIVSSIFLNTDSPCFRKNINSTLISFFVFEVKGHIDFGMIFQVPNFEARFPSLEHHNFRFT